MQTMDVSFRIFFNLRRMDKKIIILASIVSFSAVILIYNLYSIVTVKQTVVENALPEKVKNIVESQVLPQEELPDPPPPAFQPPLDRAGERITKKKFGQYITPQNSPVKPEKFRGYHTGTDFEIFPEELSLDVSVKAVCDGKIALKKTAAGYGGVLVQTCELDGGPATVVYGHLKLASIEKKAGDDLLKGEEIGILGKAYSAETNGERKHLHLSIHRGASIDIRGYVQKESELSGWVDLCSLESVCN